MSTIVRIAKHLRHAPGLRRANPLWKCLRPLYHKLISASGRGVPTVVGGYAKVRIPPEFSGVEWEQYEPEAISAVAEWAKTHPGGLMLDIGCSIGIFSVVALFTEPSLEVVAFDADLSSLAATRRLCRYASGDRIVVVCALLNDRTIPSGALNDAARDTSELLARAQAPRGDPGTTNYICLTSQGTESIPRYSLDQLFPAEKRQLLIKCDVEGAELLVLQGAQRLLAHSGPDILLSVHPIALQREYGHCTADVRRFLHREGYNFQTLAVDHEEHWWCSRRST